MSETTGTFRRENPVEGPMETRVETRSARSVMFRALGSRLMMHPRRALFAGGGLALALLAIGLLQSRSSGPMLLAAVEEGSFEVKIVESGTLQALRSVSVGVTENISRSGILFHTQPSRALREALGSKPMLDMTLELPQGGADGPPHHVHCQGRVARAVWSEGRAHPSAWAITVGDYILQAY